MRATHSLGRALEDHNQDQADINIDAEQVIIDQPEVDAVSELAENIATAEKEDEIIERSEETTEALEAFIDTIGVIAKTGGMDRKTAAVFNHAKAAYYSNLGYVCDNKDMLSLESFGGASSREYATRIALEEEVSGFRKVLADIWQFIKNTFNTIIDTIKSFTTTVGLTIRRAEAIKSKAGSTEAFNGTLSEEQAAALAQPLFDGNKTLTALDASKKLKDMQARLANKDFCQKVMAAVDKIKQLSQEAAAFQQKSTFQKINEHTLSGLWNFFTKEIKIDKKTRIWLQPKEVSIICQSIFQGMKALNSSTAEVRKVWDQGEGDYYASEILPGGYRAVAFMSTTAGDDKGDSETPNPGLDRLKIDFIQFATVPEGSKVSDKVLPRSRNDVESICDNVIDICNLRKAITLDFEKYLNSAKKSCDELESKSNGFKDQALGLARKIGSWFRNLFRGFTKPFHAIAKYNVKQCKHLLDACVFSMKGKTAEEK